MLKVNVHNVDNHTFILNLEGHLTADSTAQFHNAFLPILRKRPKAISINLSNLNSIDEAGIAILMNGLMGTADQGTYLYLVGLSDKVKKYYKARCALMGHSSVSTRTH
jgi:anti-anti-sigma factor